jgi:hypothetical protein
VIENVLSDLVVFENLKNLIIFEKNIRKKFGKFIFVEVVIKIFKKRKYEENNIKSTKNIH